MVEYKSTTQNRKPGESGMTLQELYAGIGGDYEQALRVLRADRLVDKHIRKLAKNGVIEALMAAGETMDPAGLFETAHAAKGNCGNLGLTRLAALASEIAEGFRPGRPRTMTDEEAAGKLREIAALYARTKETIDRYDAEQPQ